MIIRAFILIFCLTGPILIFGQEFDVLQVDDNFTDKSLVEDIFLKGFCNNVSNIQTVGEPFSVGHFFNGDDIIGINEGIIISCGNIFSASSPNVNTETTTIIGTSGDKDLSRIATAPVFDASGITFEFVPLNNRVSFNYVFASEEYCEWVGTAFNDVFGFFVSGPGINGEFSDGGINVARVPGSEDFVSINTINHAVNSDLYISNELLRDARRCAKRFEANFVNNIEFDGFTVPITAEFDVIPCEKYTIRLIVSDVNDELFDSAVFLEMNSFDIGGNVIISARSETGGDPQVSESCTNGFFRFERVQADIDLDQSFDLSVGPNSTATEGLDFEPLPPTVEFAAGEKIVEIPITILSDNEPEQQEILNVILNSGCECVDEERGSLLINDDVFFEAGFNELAACEGRPFEVAPIVNGGAPPYAYLWEDGSTDSIRQLSINDVTSIDVQITDFCDRVVNASTRIDIAEVPTASIGGEFTLCEGVDQFLEVTLEGTPPWSITYQRNSDRPSEVTDIIESPFRIPVTQEGIIQLLSFNDLSCEGFTEGMASYTVEELEIEVNSILPTCPNTIDGSIAIDIVSSSPVSIIEWNPTATDPFNIQELLAGNYDVSIVDERGCTLNETIELPSDPVNLENCVDLNIYIPNVYSPNNDGSNDEFLIFLENEPQIQSVKSFSIFDRWGNKIFQRTNFVKTETDIGFNGRLSGQDLFPQVLSYVAVFNLNGGVTRSVSGSITLIR